jgi:thymidylate synthase (FAD)
MLRSEVAYKKLLTDHWTPQQARSVLPNSLKTEIVVTANMREWRHIFKMRTPKAAHPQMREIMIPLLEEVNGAIPVLFEDIYNDLQD